MYDTINSMDNSIFGDSVFSPFKELVSYEYLWSRSGSSLKNISEKLSLKKIQPSDLIQQDLFGQDKLYSDVENFISARLKNFSVMFKEDFQFPQKLLTAKNPIDMFYYRGNLDLLESPCISIVGSRKMSMAGKARAQKLAKALCKNYTIVSGLAAGIDTAALTAAIKAEGNVIAVIGTPIDRYYPKENKILQDYIAFNHLLISQVPLYKYDHQPFNSKRAYFPERNITMAALSEATVIVEASETSGTHIQAKACFDQGKKLFILNSCFENDQIQWPQKYLAKGAYRINSVEQILEVLGK